MLTVLKFLAPIAIVALLTTKAALAVVLVAPMVLAFALVRSGHGKPETRQLVRFAPLRERA